MHPEDPKRLVDGHEKVSSGQGRDVSVGDGLQPRGRCYGDQRQSVSGNYGNYHTDLSRNDAVRYSQPPWTTPLPYRHTVYNGVNGSRMSRLYSLRKREEDGFNQTTTPITGKAFVSGGIKRWDTLGMSFMAGVKLYINEEVARTDKEAENS
ncbi:hypothetical protein BaRGS_00028368 [Batillaria attramentaria]|uniref:Uncharacterized protein n=1 Tax=Batillaria attramentaria TaxID=370345 RepID=A0ABD0K0D2_9CAEN